MKILQNVPLKLHSTMRLGGTAAYLVEVHSKHELVEALAWADERKLATLMIGKGSNIIWQDSGFDGLVLVNHLRGLTISADGVITIAAGEVWDEAVAQTVAAGLSGIEALSLIPGTAGGTPVQNVGAYGQEIAQTLIHVEAYDKQSGEFIILPADECDFGYRSSRFKGTDRGRFFITGIALRLHTEPPKPPFYNALQHYFDEHAITTYTAQSVRDAVIAIRSSKLPDPAKVANNGSFFANPILSASDFATIQSQHPHIAHWVLDDGRVKIPAAWLLEQAGFKDYHDAQTGMGTWPQQPLVLVNEHARSTSQLLTFRQNIIDTVRDKFGVTLEQEPELLPR